MRVPLTAGGRAAIVAIGLASACGSKSTDTPPPANPGAHQAQASSPVAAPTDGGLLNSGAGQIGSKTVAFKNDTWTPVGLSSEGIEIKEIRFSVEGGIHWNPLRAGIGPQAFVSLQNHESHQTRSAVAVALFDAAGSLVGATDATTGNLDPNESKEITLTFREVKRRFFEAKSAQIALETYK